MLSKLTLLSVSIITINMVIEFGSSSSSYCAVPASYSSVIEDWFECPSSCYNSPCKSSEDPCCEYGQSKVNGCNECKSGYFKKDYDHPCVHCQGTFGDGCLFCQDWNGCGQCDSHCQRIYDYKCELYYCECGDKPTPKPTWSRPTPKPTPWTAPPTWSRPTPKPTPPPTPWTPPPTWSRPTPKPTPPPTPWTPPPTPSPTLNTPSPTWKTPAPTSCIESCKYTPCSCSKYDELELNCDVCHEGAGCNQCKSGYFKPTDNHPCVDCQEYTGDGCMFCNDKFGCAQCKSHCTHYYDNDCNLWKCSCPPTVWVKPTPKPTWSPTPKPVWVKPTPKPTWSPTPWTTPPTPRPTWSPTQKVWSSHCLKNRCDNKPCKCYELSNCKVCHSPEGCDECNDGYFKQSYNDKCVHCQDTLGYGCMHCTDFIGCQQCGSHCTRYFDEDCELWKCNCKPTPSPVDWRR